MNRTNQAVFKHKPIMATCALASLAIWEFSAEAIPPATHPKLGTDRTNQTIHPTQPVSISQTSKHGIAPPEYSPVPNLFQASADSPPVWQHLSEPVTPVALATIADREFQPQTNPSRSETDILAQTSPAPEKPPIPEAIAAAAPASPLTTRQPIFTTADQLRQGEIVIDLRYRQSFPQGSAQSVGLTGQPTLGFTWGITNALELTFDAQTVDNSGPVRQGVFRVQRINLDGGGPNFLQEVTLQAKQRLWQNATETLALSGVIATSIGGRPMTFSPPIGTRTSGQNSNTVFSLELPLSFRPDNRWQFTVSPKVAFLPAEHALYFVRPPVTNPGSFGTVAGLAAGLSYRLSPRLAVWGDVFVPFTGNNTINRNSGLPARTAVFNAGLRYLVNPRLATDIFVSNALGNTGAIAMVGDRDYLSLGLAVSYMPGITSANRQYPTQFGAPPSHSNTPAGFALLDGGTIPGGQLAIALQGGGQGILTGIRYGLMDDLEIGLFADNISGKVDESELGISGKIRFLNQASGDPFSLSGLVTVSRANNVLINLVDNNRNALATRGLQKGGFVFSNEGIGELLIATVSAPMHYQFKGGSALWLTPTLGFVQRSGLELAGVTLGGSVPLAKTVEAIAEAGVELGDRGNAFIGNTRATVIPWSAGLRWQPPAFLGIQGLQLEAYVTNRVGASPFHSLRVRADNATTIGVGVVVPIR